MRWSSKWAMAGRGPELGAIQSALLGDTYDAAVVYGASGVGKTRLAYEAMALVEAAGRATATALASESAAQFPLGALAPILPVDLAPDATPAAVYRATLDALVARGGDRRPILFVDDAHLLDGSSALLLTQLLNARAVTVLATVTGGEPMSDLVATWWRRETTLRVDLTDLTSEATGEALSSALGGRVSMHTTRKLHRASGGNPLVLRQLVKQAVGTGQLSDATGSWRLAGDLAPSPRLIDLFGPRLAGVGDEARRVLEQLALCGPLGATELAGFESGIPADLLVGLERDGLIAVSADDRRGQLVLAHPIHAEILRAELPTLRRQTILLATADRIESLGARRREDARRVASWRLDAGSSPDPELLLQGARFARYAHDFGQLHRLATALWSMEHTAEVSVLLGEALSSLGRFAQAEEVLAAAVPADSDPDLLMLRNQIRSQNLLWGLGLTEAAMAAVDEAKATLGPEYADHLAVREGTIWHFACRPRKAFEVLDSVNATTDEVRVTRDMVKGQVLLRMGRTAEAIEVATEALPVHMALAEPVALAHPGAHIINQAYALMEAGRFAEGDELARLGYDQATESNLPYGQAWFALIMGKSCHQQGRFVEGRSWLEEAAATAQAHSLRGPERLARCGLAADKAMVNEVAGAQADLARASELPAFDFLRFDEAIGWAWTSWAAGDEEAARKILVARATEAADLGNVGMAAWLWHDAARLGVTDVAGHLTTLEALSDGVLVTARARFVRALEADDANGLEGACEAFEDLGMVLVAAEAAAAAAAAHRRHGDQRAGTAWTARAVALARRCPGAGTPGIVTDGHEAPLTAREREIAGLAQRGLSSALIAERLFLSVRTVNNHLAHVYRKLGVRGRGELDAALTLR